MTSDTIVLPQPSEPPRRGPVPILAAVVPIGAGIALWLITGSLFALCFAALGPLMMAASVLDARRLRKKEARVIAHREAEAWDRAERQLREAHTAERARLRRAAPNTADCLAEPPLRGSEPFAASARVAIGSGTRRSDVRVSGGEGPRAESFRSRAAEVAGVPMTLEWGNGICVRGPAVLTEAVARALLTQVCLRFGPRQLALDGAALQDVGVDGFPHAVPRKGVPTLTVLRGAEPPSAPSMQLRLLDRTEAVPDGITTVIDVGVPAQSRVRTAQGSRSVALECLSYDQARAIAEATRAQAPTESAIPDVVALSETTTQASAGTLEAAIGRTAMGVMTLDLVGDGPHAIVTGMTGTGKSELLVSWVVSIAQQHSPERVIFVLADFKGGTAFDPLRQLPHVVAVMTDLDEENSRRGVQSLTAELRRREGALAAAGAREISEIRMPRLVIVVDEFAALLQEHPDLAAVFTDIAARGRALGMHLILGTQRASGVVRDALAANCPLRISLRVSDSADSRAVIGTDDASAITGGPSARGMAFIRRPQDDHPQGTRIALTAEDDIRDVRSRWKAAPTSQSPWLPPLPSVLPLPESTLLPEGTIAIGVADDPDRQRQEWVSLRIGVDRGIAVVGGPGSGKTSALRALHEQVSDALLIPRDPECAWDAVEQLLQTPTPPALVLCDDLDALSESFPLEYAQLFLQRWERVLRTTPSTVVLASAKATGGLARVMDALPDRAILRMNSRLDHLAHGGEPEAFQPYRESGRARLRGRETQLAWVPEVAHAGHAASRMVLGRSENIPLWSPPGGVSGVITHDPRSVVQALRLAHPTASILEAGEHTHPPASESVGEGVQIFVGDGEDWQRQWALFRALRADSAIVVSAECATELRSMLAVKELPPYARPHSGRAWELTQSRPRRVRLPRGIDDSRHHGE